MPKVLIVDDDLELQDLLKFTFEKHKYEVYQAFDGEEAIKKVTEILPEIVILDIIMPKKNGFEVIEELRTQPSTCLIPVIMLTSLSQTKDKLTGLKLGADEYLVKPVDPYELLTRAENLVYRYYENIGSSITKLPGNNHLEFDIKTKLDTNQQFCIIYLNLSNFAAYNYKYGYSSGDNVLKLFTGMLRSIVTNYGNPTDTIYNIYADHFVVLSTEDKAEDIGKSIMTLFNEQIKKFYDEETIVKGSFEYKTKTGETATSTLMKVLIGITDVTPGKFRHYAEVLDYVKELCKIAKQQSEQTNNNALVIG